MITMKSLFWLLILFLPCCGLSQSDKLRSYVSKSTLTADGKYHLIVLNIHNITTRKVDICLDELIRSSVNQSSYSLVRTLNKGLDTLEVFLYNELQNVVLVPSSHNPAPTITWYRPSAIYTIKKRKVITIGLIISKEFVNILPHNIIFKLWDCKENKYLSFPVKII
jgi:hypothetical protein